MFMRDSLRKRLLRVASDIKHLKNYHQFYEEMSGFSDSLNAMAAASVKALQARDVDLLSKSLLENKKVAQELSIALQRQQRILMKLESK